MLETNVQNFQFLSKYSKFKLGVNQYESFEESIERVVQQLFQFSGNKLSNYDIDLLHKQLSSLGALPSMRLWRTAGQEATRNNASIYNCAYTQIDHPKKFSEVLYLLMSGTGVGYSVEKKFVYKLPRVPYFGGESENYVIPDSQQGWAESVDLLINRLYNGETVNFDYSQVRPEGAILRTKGGFASGPEPLKRLHKKIVELFREKQGSRLEPIDCYDILTMIGECGGSGGSRRSASICLFDIDDEAMLRSKEGIYKPGGAVWRQNANNSAVIDRQLTREEINEFFDLMFDGNNGDPGWFSRYAAHESSPHRFKLPRNVKTFSGTNPCLTIDTIINTKHGQKKVGELIGKQFTAIVDGKEYESTEQGFWYTGDKPTYRINAKGFSVELTGNHKVQIWNKELKEFEWVETKDVKAGDKIRINHSVETNANWSGLYGEDEGWLLGNLIGDGTFTNNEEHPTKSSSAHLRYWDKESEHSDSELMKDMVVELVHDTVGARSDSQGIYNEANNFWQVSSTKLAELASEFGILPTNKCPDDRIYSTSSDFYKGFIAGLFDADGTIGKTFHNGTSVRINNSDYELLQTVQIMLNALGIIGKIYKRQNARYRAMPDGNGGLKDYYCKENYEIIITAKSMDRFSEIIPLRTPYKAEQLSETVSGRNAYRDLNRVTVDSVELTGNVEPVYDCTIDTVHAFGGNGLYLHNCAEILIHGNNPYSIANNHGGQFCNLTNAVVRYGDTKEEIREKVIAATIMGTIQATATNFPYLSQGWEIVTATEALLGVGLTGFAENHNLSNPQFLRELRNLVKVTNAEYAERFGINKAMDCTTVKPSGNSSLFANTTPGNNPYTANYQIRNMATIKESAVGRFLRNKHPELVMQHPSKENNLLVSFPLETVNRVETYQNPGALQQLENWKLVKENWTDHNVSTTIAYESEEEKQQIKNWMFVNQKIANGLAFFPKFDADHPYLPIFEIDKNTYEEKKASEPNIDWSKVNDYVIGDADIQDSAVECSSGECVIVY